MHHDLVVIDRFTYRTPWVSVKGHCKIEARKLTDGRVAVIATELADNQGPSVTNAVEYLATAVCLYLGIDPHNVIWIEYYGYPAPGNPDRKRTYDRVTFNRIRSDEEISFFDPSWAAMSVQDWQLLNLEPPPSLF